MTNKVHAALIELPVKWILHTFHILYSLNTISCRKVKSSHWVYWQGNDVKNRPHLRYRWADNLHSGLRVHLCSTLASSSFCKWLKWSLWWLWLSFSWLITLHPWFQQLGWCRDRWTGPRQRGARWPHGHGNPRPDHFFHHDDHDEEDNYVADNEEQGDRMVVVTLVLSSWWWWWRWWRWGWWWVWRVWWGWWGVGWRCSRRRGARWPRDRPGHFYHHGDEKEKGRVRMIIINTVIIIIILIIVYWSTLCMLEESNLGLGSGRPDNDDDDDDNDDDWEGSILISFSWWWWADLMMRLVVLKLHLRNPLTRTVGG